MPSYAGGVNDKAITNENIFVMNQGKRALLNTNFMLRVEGVTDVPCRKVSAFTRQNEFEYIQEGGLNDYVHMKRKYISKPFTLTIERYAGGDYVDPLPLGMELTLPLVLFVSQYPGLFAPGMVARTYTFTGCTVISKTWGELNAEASGLLVETIEIAYKEFAELNIPLDPNTEDKEAIKKDNRTSTEKYTDAEAIPKDERKPTEPYIDKNAIPEDTRSKNTEKTEDKDAIPEDTRTGDGTQYVDKDAIPEVNI